MKKPVLMSLLATLLVAMSWSTASAQGSRVYRCGNVYTNNPPPGQKDCKPLEGGNVTVVKSPPASDGARVAAMSQAAASLEADRNRQKDLLARQTLEAELRKAQARQEELARQLNNGEPEKMGSEFRNHQKYLDRVADLKSDMARNEAEIEDLRRELARFGSN